MGKITVSHDKDLDVAVFSLEGEVSYEAIRDSIEDYYKGKLTKYTLWDFTNANNIKHLSTSEVKKLGGQVSIRGKARRGCFDVLVLPEILQYGLGRMYAAYMEMTGSDTDVLKTKVFRTKDAAIEWIRKNEKHVFTAKHGK